MESLLEVQRMAQAALAKANDALHAAGKVEQAQEDHEKLCAERYKNIYDKINCLPDIFTAINRLNAIANRAIGLWMFIPALGAVVAIVVGIVEVVRR